MKTTKILPSETAPLKISSLPTRPTAPQGYGGCGYTAADMKAAFDKLPMLIVERFNSLIDDIFADKDESILSDLKTGLSEDHTLSDLIDDLKNGNFTSYLTLSGTDLATVIEEMRYDIENIYLILSKHGINYQRSINNADRSTSYTNEREGTYA